MGQKSSANHRIIGLPITIDPKNTRASAAEPSTGCAKYTNVLPVATAIEVFTDKPTATNTCTPDTDRPESARNPTAA
ncbi:MAG: hypothetical protein OEV40_25185 [Acidimicrobiia bacterium]|nr:hypothetical protein [Acidimicrobiia bacterium]